MLGYGRAAVSHRLRGLCAKNKQIKGGFCDISPSRVATCLVLVLLRVSLREASAARPLRPAGDASSDSEQKAQAIVDK